MTEQEADAAVAAHSGILLGIQSPWKVKRAKLEIARKRVDIEVEHETGKPVRCPQCQRECRRHDHAPERTWRHLDLIQFTRQIRACLPRCACDEHKVVTLVPPWAEPGSRFTLIFAAFLVQVLLASASLTQAAELQRLDWDSVQSIMDRAVARGLARRSIDDVTRGGLDEKSFGRGHSYISLMTDHNPTRVLDALVEGDQSMAFEQFLGRELKTAKAWAFKEAFVEFWSQPDGLRAKLFFELWYDTVIRSKLKQRAKSHESIQNQIRGLVYCSLAGRGSIYRDQTTVSLFTKIL